MDVFGLIREGFVNNLLVTLLSLILPLGIGVLFSFFSGLNKTVGKIFSWLSLIFEIFCPIVLMLCFYFFIPSLNPMLAVVFALSISFLGYMPARYIYEKSFLYNILYNGLGLISSIFKWSLCAGYVGYMDVLKAAELLRGRTFDSVYLIYPLVISVVFLLFIELLKRIVKNVLFK